MNGGWRFALSRRWLGYLALVIVFAVACVFLSQWQFARYEEESIRVERIERNWDAAPVSLRQVMPTLDTFEADETWQPVAVTGRYLADQQVLVRNRPLDSRVGFEVLVPLRLDDGTVLVIDRGWIAAGSAQDAPDAVPAPPEGQVTVTARIKPGEPAIPGRSAPEGQLATIDLDALATTVGGDVYTSGYGVLADEQPAPASSPRPIPMPRIEQGPNLSYALQWVAFGVLAFIGLAWAVRREYRILNEDDPEVQAKAEARARRAATRAPSDDEIEDAILDRADR